MKFTGNSTIFFLMALFLSSTFVHAGDSYPKTFYDKGGMPRCISLSSENEILFTWNESERFERQINVISVADIPMSPDERKTLNCSAWGVLSGKVPSGADEILAENDQRFQNKINKDDQERLSQVRLGGSVYRSEISAADFLAKSPIVRFDRETNRKLTAHYGVGFVNDIYRQLVNAKPLNQSFKKIVQGKLDLERGDQLPPMGIRFKGYTFVLVSGYMQSPTNDRLSAVLESLKGEGIDTVMAKINPVGGMLENAGLVRGQLSALLDQGKNLIVMAGSKGGPELLAALSQLQERIDGSKFGTIKAFVSLSSVLDGSFIVDWAMKLPQRPLVMKDMSKEAKIMGLGWESDGFKSMDSKEVEAFLNTNVLGHLPRTMRYFGIIGIPGGTGLVSDKSISTLQNSVVRPHVHGFGGNDGYVEFPGTSLSDKIIPNTYELVFDSSHIILDGHYQNYDMSKNDQREFVFNALFEALADVAGL